MLHAGGCCARVYHGGAGLLCSAAGGAGGGQGCSGRVSRTDLPRWRGVATALVTALPSEEGATLQPPLVRESWIHSTNRQGTSDDTSDGTNAGTTLGGSFRSRAPPFVPRFVPRALPSFPQNKSAFILQHGRGNSGPPLSEYFSVSGRHENKPNLIPTRVYLGVTRGVTRAGVYPGVSCWVYPGVTSVA